jgi:hypothetical protein
MFRKLSVTVLFMASTAWALANLGAVKPRSASKPSASLLSARKATNASAFNLMSGYDFKGNQVINLKADRKLFELNTTVTVNRGGTVYSVPLRKTALLDKIRIEIGNQQLKRN